MLFYQATQRTILEQFQLFENDQKAGRTILLGELDIGLTGVLNIAHTKTGSIS